MYSECVDILERQMDYRGGVDRLRAFVSVLKMVAQTLRPTEKQRKWVVDNSDFFWWCVYVYVTGGM